MRAQHLKVVSLLSLVVSGIIKQQSNFQHGVHVLCWSIWEKFKEKWLFTGLKRKSLPFTALCLILHDGVGVNISNAHVFNVVNYFIFSRL